jgi:hypothetical protein
MKLQSEIRKDTWKLFTKSLLYMASLSLWVQATLPVHYFSILFWIFDKAWFWYSDVAEISDTRVNGV